MSKFKGIDFVLKVNTGTIDIPVYSILGGQRGATLNRSVDTIEVTTKHSNNWKEFLPSIGEWSIDADGLVVDSDVAFNELERCFMDRANLLIELTTPGGKTYKGTVIITDFPIELPYDDAVTYSAKLNGTGELTAVAI